MSENLLRKACAFVLRLESSCLNTTKNHTLWCCASALYLKLNLGTFNNPADKNMHFADWLPDEQPKCKGAALRNLDSQLARLVNQIFICTFDMFSHTNAGIVEHLLGNWRFRRASAPFAQERHICPEGFDPCPLLWSHRPRGKASAWYRTAYQGKTRGCTVCAGDLLSLTVDEGYATHDYRGAVPWIVCISES